jgi:hypothetical protein
VNSLSRLDYISEKALSTKLYADIP